MSALPSTASVLRGTQQPDGYGGTLAINASDPTTYTEVTTGVRCRVGSPSTRQKYRTDVQTKDADVDVVVIFTNYTDDIVERDMMLVENTPGSGQWLQYTVENVKDPGLAHHHLEITVQVVK